MSDFGELRSLLHGEVDRAQWEALCARLDGWDTRELEERALPYVGAAVEAWPDALKVAPRRWLERWAAGGELGALRLARRAELGRGDSATLEGMLRRGAWTRLDVLSVRTPGALTKELMASELVGGLREFEVRHEPGVQIDEVRALSTRRDLGRLERLVLDACGLGEDATMEIVRGGGLRGLRALEVREGEWGERALRALGDGALSSLVSLHVSGRPWPHERPGSFGWDGASALLDRGDRASKLGARLTGLTMRRVFARQPGPGQRALDMSRLGALERLDLSRNAIDDATWEAMTSGGLPTHLARLNVSRTALEGAALAQSLEATGVRQLDIVEVPLTVTGAAALRVSGALSGLERFWMGSGGQSAQACGELLRGCGPGLVELCVWRAPLSAGSIEALSARVDGAMRRLVLEGCSLGDAGLMRLCEANLSGLEELNLSNSKLRDASLGALGRARWRAGLRKLNLSQGAFTMRGLRRIWEEGGMGRLRSLSLAGCGLGAAEAMELAQTPELGALTELDLSFNAIGEEGRRALRTSKVLGESVKEAYR